MNRKSSRRTRRPGALACLSVSALIFASGTLHAEEKNVSVTLGSTNQGTSQASASSTSTQKKPPAGEAPKTVPKDPENKKGISPFWEKLIQGDTAATAHDYVTALSYYQSALTSDPKQALGHLRMAEVSLKLKQLEKIPEYLEAAGRFAEGDLRTRAQALFLWAMLHEQKNLPDEALSAWAKYKALALETEAAAQGKEESVPKPAKVQLTSPDLRTAAISKQKELAAAYASVKERIQKNVDAADEATGGGAAPRPEATKSAP